MRGVAQKLFDLIRNQSLVETRPEQFFETLNLGTVSTNIYLRRLHNFALDMGWLLAPIVPRHKWPPIHFKTKRAITAGEHQKILAGESNLELRHYYRQVVGELSECQIFYSGSAAAFFRSSSGKPRFSRERISHWQLHSCPNIRPTIYINSPAGDAARIGRRQVGASEAHVHDIH